jgi:hypothetical protein
VSSMVSSVSDSEPQVLPVNRVVHTSICVANLRANLESDLSPCIQIVLTQFPCDLWHGCWSLKYFTCCHAIYYCILLLQHSFLMPASSMKWKKAMSSAHTQKKVSHELTGSTDKENAEIKPKKKVVIL